MADLNSVKVPEVNLYASFTLPGYQTLPGQSSHQAIRRASTEESYLDWQASKELNPQKHKKLNFDRVHWETQSLIDGALQGDKEGIDVKRYHNPEHPANTAWWWADKCEADRQVYNARLRHMKRLRPNLTEPLSKVNQLAGSVHALKDPIAQDDTQRRRDRRAQRKAEKQAMWNEIWKMQTAKDEKQELFEHLWDEHKSYSRASSRGQSSAPSLR
jgi:hypothetical protein